MINKEQCPTCGIRKMELQPEAINGRQDVFYECGGAITYDVENPSDTEETGNCENKFDWTHIYIEYGGEFDESAKLVDDRFFGWIEYDFYKKIHSGKWNIDNPGKNFLDKEFLDKYFSNKEIYIKEKRDFNGELNIIEDDGYVAPAVMSQILKKTYEGDMWLGEVDVCKVSEFEQGGFNKIIYKVLASQYDPKLIGGYVVENNQIGGGDSSVDFYDREIIEVIIKHEVG